MSKKKKKDKKKDEKNKKYLDYMSRPGASDTLVGNPSWEAWEKKHGDKARKVTGWAAKTAAKAYIQDQIGDAVRDHHGK